MNISLFDFLSDLRAKGRLLSNFSPRLYYSKSETEKR